MKIRDKQFMDRTIVSVQQDGKQWSFGMNDGWSFWFKHRRIKPKPGDRIRLYGRGAGYTIRGLFINGREVFYRTRSQDAEYHRRMFAADRLRRKLLAKREAHRRAAEIAQLPAIFRERIDGFRARNHRFDIDRLPYELFVCQQAVIIADALKTAPAIVEFSEQGSAKQKEMVPLLSNDHSGNTFGASCYLAKLYLERPDLVPKAHGALCPLVGCASYGCYSTTVWKEGNTP